MTKLDDEDESGPQTYTCDVCGKSFIIDRDDPSGESDGGWLDEFGFTTTAICNACS